MYADRESGGATKISVKERLNIADSGRRRQITGKRQRQDDDKWEHDLYDHDNPQVSKDRRVGARDLRLKLQKKSIQSTTQSGKGSLSGGIRDLRERLSGTMTSQPVDTAPPKPRAVPEGSKPPRKVAVEAPVLEPKKVASMVSKKKSQHKVESVDSFLQSLGLEKYSITFQAEEVDMATLLHMNDDDLKAMGIPMGPRKKILLALDSNV